MMITTEQAQQMVADKMSKDAAASKPAETTEESKVSSAPEESSSSAESEKEEPKETNTEASPKEPEPEENPKTEEETEAKTDEQPEKDETKKSDKRTPPAKKYSKAERIAHAFSIEKQKRKELKEKWQKDREYIKKLEEENAKYKGLKLEDFDNKTEEYMNYRLREQDVQREMDSRKKQLEAEENEAARRENARRVEISFPDEAERQAYYDMIEHNREAFTKALAEYDEENVVMKYLSRIDCYPIVLRELMTNPETLGRVFCDPDPDIRRINLANVTHELLDEYFGRAEDPKKTDSGKPEQTNQPAPKPAIPITGRQVTSAAKPSEPVHDRAFWNEYLKKHPHG